MKHYAKEVNDIQQIFAKHSILSVWQGSECASEYLSERKTFFMKRSKLLMLTKRIFHDFFNENYISMIYLISISNLTKLK